MKKKILIASAAAVVLAVITFVIYHFSNSKSSARDVNTTNNHQNSTEPKRIDTSGFLISDTMEFVNAPGSTVTKNWWDSAEFIDYYQKRVIPPPFDSAVDINKLSLEDLRYKKNEILARKGYEFPDANFRAYFMGKDWYQPPFFLNLKIELSPWEKQFMARCLQREKALVKQNFIAKDGKQLPNIKNVINQEQFQKASPVIMQALEKQGLAIIPTNNNQFFQIYEQNDYGLLPSFITTDMYLQLLHMHFDYVMRNVEEKQLMGRLKKLSDGMQAQVAIFAKESGANAMQKKASDFNFTYFNVLSNLLAGSAHGKNNEANTELINCMQASSVGSAFLQNDFFDYSLFKPRGHYNRNDSLKRYFKAMMWLQKAPVYQNKDEEFAKSVVMAYALLKGQNDTHKPLLDDYMAVYEPIVFLIGDAGNYSIKDMANLLGKGEFGKDLASSLQAGNLAKLRNALKSIKFESIKPKGSNKEIEKDLQKPSICFMPARYTPDAEMLQRLVNNLEPERKRPFPKGLDVFAVMGNKTAEGILLNEEKEAQNWPGYADTLRALQKKFDGFPAKDNNIYNKTLFNAGLLSKVPANAPYFMLGDVWQRKQLNTALGAWTELKHDAILYAEQPQAAECGGGPGPSQPVVVGYVEPSIDFWQGSIEWLDKLDVFLKKYNSSTNGISGKNKMIKELAEQLLRLSKKELNHERLTVQEYDNIRVMGSTVENMTVSILEMPGWYAVDKSDTSVAVAADVFTNMSPNGNFVLEETVGNVNQIYVVIEIEGFLYITSGAVFNYREFQWPAAQRLTDEEWQKMQGRKNLPPSPKWLKDILLPVPALKAKGSFSFGSGC